MLPKNIATLNLLQEAAADGMAVAELEYLGVSLRTINSLEESSYKCVFLKDLLRLSAEDICSIRNLGTRGLTEISEALNRISELEEIKKKWHKGSDRLDFYMKKIPKLSFTFDE